MNNRGFAITGIIYTLFVFFLMILLAVLSISSSYQRMIMKSVEDLELSFEGKKVSERDYYYEELVGDTLLKKALFTGKYIYESDFTGNGNKTYCSFFVVEGDDITNISSFKLSPEICNNYSEQPELFELKAVYKFLEEN